MPNTMAILQEVDKCIRCSGCQLSCKRTWKMLAPSATYGRHKINSSNRVMVKSQKRVDMGPFVRYSCWHCPFPACAGRCPFKAIVKASNGAVMVDHTKCDPTKCLKQCVLDCQRGGFPRVGIGTSLYPTYKMQKCTMCYGRAGVEPGADLPTKATAGEIALVPEKAHQPACVFTCPAKAMQYDTLTNITNNIRTGGYLSVVGNGNMFWASKRYVIAAPKADPLVEDHLAPAAGLLSGPFAKAALVPTLVVGGLLALSARRAKIEDESLEEVR